MGGAVRTLLVIATSFAAATPRGTPAPKYRVVKHLSLETRTEPPTFVCLDGLQLLDRGRIVQIGRPVEAPNVLTVLDLRTFEVANLTIPDVPGTQVPSRTEMSVDRPLFYDTDNGTAGILMRAGGVTGDAGYAEWDLRANRIVRRLPLAGPDGARWMSVTPIGYDPVRKEGYVEVVKYGVRFKTSPNRGGHYDLTVLGVGERVRTIASLTTRLKFGSKGPYFDLARRRSMHIEYAEYAGNVSAAYLVDLDTGTVKTYQLPPVVYGFTFDPGGRTGYVYSFRDSELLKLDLETGELGPKRRVGSYGHLVEFVGPGLLLLARNPGLHLIDAATLKERWFLDSKKVNAPGLHVEGSVVLPGRILLRNGYELFVVDFPIARP